MTVETKPAVAPPNAEAWPFLEKLNAGAIMVVCASAVELQRSESRSLPSAIALTLISTRLKGFFNNPLLNRLPDSSSRRVATSGYHDLLFSIPLTELTMIHGLPKHSNGKSNYIDRNADLDHKVDPPLTEKVDSFLRFQRYAGLLREDPTAISMLEAGVMSAFYQSAARPEGFMLKSQLERPSVKRVDDLFRLEVRGVLNAQVLGSMQAYTDYQKVYPVILGQRPPEMI